MRPLGAGGRSARLGAPRPPPHFPPRAFAQRQGLYFLIRHTFGAFFLLGVVRRYPVTALSGDIKPFQLFRVATFE